MFIILVIAKKNLSNINLFLRKSRICILNTGCMTNLYFWCPFSDIFTIFVPYSNIAKKIFFPAISIWGHSLRTSEKNLGFRASIPTIQKFAWFYPFAKLAQTHHLKLNDKTNVVRFFFIIHIFRLQNM